MSFMSAWYPTGVVIEPRSRRKRRSRGRAFLWAVGLGLAACAVAIGGALLAWPQPNIEADDAALAHVVQPGYAGHVSTVVVRGPNGKTIPVDVRRGRLWPNTPLTAGEQLTVELTVRRPGWAGWLVGHTARTSLVVRTPSAHLRGRWLEIAPGAPVVASFDTPVQRALVRVNGRLQTFRFATPRRTVELGVVANGATKAGSASIRAVPRVWEKLPLPARLSWFPARKLPQALVEPALGVALAPDRPITLTFSRPVQAALGTALPTITPRVPGRWHLLDTHTLAFRPTGLGFPLGAHVRVRLPQRVEQHRAAAPRALSPGTCATGRSCGSSSFSPRRAISP